MLNFRKKKMHQISRNPIRMGKDEEIKVDLKWKTLLPLKYKLTFNFHFGWLNYYYRVNNIR